MNRKEYSAGAVKFSFWFLEFKKTVGLLASGKTIKDIKAINVEENLFNASSADRAKLIMNCTTKRIDDMGMDSQLCSLFVNADLNTQKLICLIAVMVSDTLFFDFVYSIIREKIILGTNSYSESDIREFWRTKQQESEKVSGFTDATLKRLASTYKAYLSDSGITSKTTDIKEIYAPIFDDDLVKWLESHDLQPVIAALNGR